MKEKCCNCRFYEQIEADEDEEKNTGYCHRYPMVFVGEPTTYDEITDEHFQHPVMPCGEWCGEWKEKTE